MPEIVIDSTPTTIVLDDGAAIVVGGRTTVAVDGTVEVAPPTALDDLTDVNAPTPTDAQVLTWDDGAGEWVAVDPGGGDAPRFTNPILGLPGSLPVDPEVGDLWVPEDAPFLRLRWDGNGWGMGLMSINGSGTDVSYAVAQDGGIVVAHGFPVPDSFVRLQPDRLRWETTGDVQIIVSEDVADPSAGSGYSAGVGSLFLSKLASGLWRKSDTADTDWELVGSGGGGGAVDSVNGATGDVVLDAADVGAATSAQGALADTAVQPGDLATVATSGAYADLTGTPSIPDSPDDIGAAAAGHDHAGVYDPAGTAAGLVDDLSGVSNAATARTNLGLGTAATVNTGTGASNVILGNDARLTDARTPTSHAASHASGGGDAITIAQSQVTNLTTDLAGKAATSHAHAGTDITSGTIDIARLPVGTSSTTVLRGDTTIPTQYTDEMAQDAAAAALVTNGTHSGLTATYVDGSNAINLTVAGSSDPFVVMASRQTFF